MNPWLVQDIINFAKYMLDHWSHIGAGVFGFLHLAQAHGGVRPYVLSLWDESLVDKNKQPVQNK